MDNKPYETSAQPDDELVAGYLAGDSLSFNALLDRYQQKLYNYIRRYVRSKEEAQDLFQEVFFRVIERLPQYRREGFFKAWLFRIAFNLCIDVLRKRSKTKMISMHQQAGEEQDSPSLEDSLASNELLPRDLAQTHESRGVLADSIEKLPSEQKEVLYLRIYAGLSFKEISRVVQSPLNTVLARMHYALAHLRRSLAEKGVFDEL